MARRPKIIWTLTEEADWFAAFKAAAEKRKATYPMTDIKLVMQCAREALLVIKADRRRDISSIDNIAGDLRQRLIDVGIFPRNAKDVLRRTPKAQPEAVGPDPKDERIAELEQQVAQSENEAVAFEQQLHLAQERIKELEQRPDAMTVVRRWMSGMIADALVLADDAKKPAAQRSMQWDPAHEERRRAENALPEHERERRANPQPTATGVYKPKVAIVGGMDQDHAAINREISSTHADLRFYPRGITTGRLDTLRQLVGTGGRVILWSDHIGHDVEGGLKHRGVDYHRHSGNLNSLIERVKSAIIAMRTKHGESK